MNTTLEEAIAAVEAGEQEKGQQLLLKVLKEEPRNERAWYLMSELVADPERKRQSLQMVLEINPDHERAKQELARLKEERGESRRQTNPNSQTVEEVGNIGPFSYLAVAITSGLLFLVVLFTLIGTIYLILRQEPQGTPPSVTQREMDDIDAEATAKTVTEVIAALTSVAPTPTNLLPPTNTPIQSTPVLLDDQDACQAATFAYMNDIEPLLSEFVDTLEVASSTSRIALSPVVQDLQSIRRRVENVPSPACASEARNMVISGLNNAISSLLAFMNDEGDITVERIMRQATLEMETGLDQLTALASGRPTPAPKPLPTDTPLPTAIPTATALPPGSPIQVGDWQIQVNRIEIRNELEFQGEITRAAGRYALLFLTVTNRARRPETFIAVGNLQVMDAEGRHFEEDTVASFHAYVMYETQLDLGVDINPDASANVVAVFDISQQSEYYVLTPGLLADPHSGSVYLPIE